MQIYFDPKTLKIYYKVLNRAKKEFRHATHIPLSIIEVDQDKNQNLCRQLLTSCGLTMEASECVHQMIFDNDEYKIFNNQTNQIETIIINEDRKDFEDNVQNSINILNTIIPTADSMDSSQLKQAVKQEAEIILKTVKYMKNKM